MILVTGGTGFIGNVLVRHLSNLGYSIKLLIRPSKETPNFPKGIPVETAIASFKDQKGLQAAMKGVDIVYHLASAISLGRKANLTEVDIQGTQAISQAASQAKVDRFFYLSHLGADRASAYPLFKAKAIAEHHIKTSGVPYTIFQSSVTYGKGDHFTNGLAFLLKVSPYFVMLPDEGSALFQPVWVEDLVTAMTWALDKPTTINETIEVGGPEYLSFKQICELIINKIKIKRQFVDVPPVFLNVVTELLEIILPTFPTSVFWMDYLASNQTTALDTLTTRFNLLPARMSQRLGYLQGRSFRRNWWRMITQRKGKVIRWN